MNDLSVCAVCAEGYTTGVGYACVRCTGSRRGAAIAVVSAILLVAVAVALVIGVKHRRRSSASTSVEESPAMRRLARVKSHLKRSGATQAIKTIIVSWQIITQASRHRFMFRAKFGTWFPLGLFFRWL